MHAHGIDVLDGAHDDAVVRLVADHLHLELLPAEHAFLDQNLVSRRGIEAPFDDFEELFPIVGDTAARPAQRERGPDDRRKPDVFERGDRLRHGVRQHGSRRFEPNSVHRLAKELPVLRLIDRLRTGADHFDAVSGKDALLVQCKSRIEGRLAAHGRQQRVGALFRNDLGDHLRRDRLDVGRVGQLGVRHDGGGIRVDQDDAIPLGLQCFAGLGAGIVEFAGLPDNDGSRADDQNGLDVGAFGHKGSVRGSRHARAQPAGRRRLA